MSRKDSSIAYFTDPEDVLTWKAIDEDSSNSALMHLKMGIPKKRRRSSDPKSFAKSEDGTGRGRMQRVSAVDDMELCAKRMKCMSLQNVKSPKTKEVNLIDIDAGYEGDCEV